MPNGAAAQTITSADIAVELQRAKIASQKAKLGAPSIPRPITSAQIEGSAFEHTAPQQSARAAEEQRRRQEMEANRRSIREAQASQIPTFLGNIPGESIQREAMQSIIRDAQDVEESSQDLEFGSPAMRHAMRRQSMLKNLAQKEVNKQIQHAISKKGVEVTKDIIWRIFGRGSVADAGEAGFTWLGIGSATTFYQVGKTIIMPGKTEDKNLLKGILSIIEPNALDLQNPMSWYDFAYAVALWLIILAAIVMLITLIAIVIIVCLAFIDAVGVLASLSNIF